MFDRDLKLRQRTWAAQQKTSAEYDYMREEFARRLVEERLPQIKRDLPKVLDLGANSGHIYRALQKSPTNGIKTLVQADSCREMLFRDAEHPPSDPSLQTERIILDEEHPQLGEASYDAVLSSLCLHWVNDLPGCLTSIRKALKPDSIFIGTLFGNDTLQELRSSFVMAEQERLGGISSHVSPLTRASDVGDVMTASGFKLLTVDHEHITVPFPSAFTLMEHLRRMGENHATFTRATNVSRDSLLSTAAAYQSMYESEDGTIPATFHVLYVVGWSPGPNQPLPLKRGTKQISIQDLAAHVEAAEREEKGDGSGDDSATK